MEAIRDDLVNDLNDMGGWVNVVAIGNGIYLEDNEAFTLETPELQLFDLIVTAEEVKDPGAACCCSICLYSERSQPTS